MSIKEELSSYGSAKQSPLSCRSDTDKQLVPTTFDTNNYLPYSGLIGRIWVSRMMTSTRLTHVLILATASLGISAASFFLGGVVAEAATANPVLGVTFKAGGALAGFIISFILLFRAYKSMGGSSFLLKVTVAPPKGKWTRVGNSFRAKTTILKRASGARKEVASDTAWEAGGLTVLIRDLEEDDMVMIVLTDSKGGRWESDFFSPLCPSITLI